MTISNKLVLIATLAVSINTCAYDAVGLKSEATKGLNFAQTLAQQPTTAINAKVAQWLQKGLANQDYSSRFNNETVIEIARIVENNPTTEAKVTQLLAVLADEEAAAAKEAKKAVKRERKWAQSRDKGAFIQGAMTCTLAMMAAYMILDLARMDLNFFIKKHDNALLEKVQEMINQATAPKKWFS